MFAGTWKANIAKSKYSPGPAPKSNTQKIESVDNGFKLVADGVNDQGQKTHNEYTVKFDGKDYPETPMLDGKPNPKGGRCDFDQEDRRLHLRSNNETKGQILTARERHFQSGKTWTSTTTGKNAQGQTVNHVVVWEKQ